jgi:ATP-dependent protease ClpP protease subunit
MSRVNSTPKKWRRGGTKNSPSKTQKDFIEGEFTQYKTEIFYNDATRTFTMYLLGEITAPEDYVNVFNTFNQAVDGETIEMFIVSGGGRKDTMDAIRGAAERTEAFTKAIVGDVGSAATIIPLIFDELEALPNTEFFCHNYSGGAFGKHHELMSQVDFMKKEMPECFRRYYKHFLTDEEIEYVIAGNDIYLNAEEVNERWQRVLAFRESELDVIIEADREATREHYIAELKKLGVDVQQTPVVPETATKVKTKKIKES